MTSRSRLVCCDSCCSLSVGHPPIVIRLISIIMPRPSAFELCTRFTRSCHYITRCLIECLTCECKLFRLATIKNACVYFVVATEHVNEFSYEILSSACRSITTITFHVFHKKCLITNCKSINRETERERGINRMFTFTFFRSTFDKN